MPSTPHTSVERLNFSELLNLKGRWYLASVPSVESSPRTDVRHFQPSVAAVFCRSGLSSLGPADVRVVVLPVGFAVLHWIGRVFVDGVPQSETAVGVGYTVRRSFDLFVPALGHDEPSTPAGRLVCSLHSRQQLRTIDNQMVLPFASWASHLPDKLRDHSLLRCGDETSRYAVAIPAWEIFDSFMPRRV